VAVWHLETKGNFLCIRNINNSEYLKLLPSLEFDAAEQPARNVAH